MSTTGDGKASWAMLLELWHLLVKGILEDLKRPKRAPVELLQVARKLLRDNGTTAPDAAARKDLEVLYRLYSGKICQCLSCKNAGIDARAGTNSWTGKYRAVAYKLHY